MAVDFGASDRTDFYDFVLVDPFTLSEVGRVDVEDGTGSVTFGFYTDNKRQAEIVLLGSNVSGDGHDYMLRIYHSVNVGGLNFRECLGTFFVDEIDHEASCGIVRGKASLYGPLLRYTKDVLLDDFVCRQGREKWKSIRDMVQNYGGKLVVGEGVDTSLKHSSNSIAEMGEEISTGINKMAGGMGCSVTDTDMGEILLQGYVAPQDKQVKYELVEGPLCTALGGFTMEQTSPHPCNRVKAYYSQDKASNGFPAFDSATVQLDPSAPFSYERTARWQTEILKLDDPCSHAELEAQASRYLAENSGSETYIEIEHCGIPNLRDGDVVRYVNASDAQAVIDVDAMITEIEMKLGPFAKCRSKLKVVRTR